MIVERLRVYSSVHFPKLKGVRISFRIMLAMNPKGEHQLIVVMEPRSLFRIRAFLSLSFRLETGGHDIRLLVKVLPFQNVQKITIEGT